ncbi:MAG: hypothetical protein M1816_004214 [Peltula sp. TS41687]|nr:MAG: hypothetical protein M1816_004214 [Peltula sp. TS41687]
MALSPSPQLSPRTATAGHSTNALKHERAMTPSPLAPPLSKRDKRRSLLAEKLQDLTTAFSQNRDSYYRQQLQALQADMTLITRADPYQQQPLEDSPDEITALIDGLISGNPHPPATGELANLSGMRYARFVQNVNSALEERDAKLTTLQAYHVRSMRKLNVDTQYKIRFAEEEERLLSSTLSERLMQTLGHRRNRLVRDKEHLDISESNALLLHPSQFSIANPLASPGGAQSNRKTRNTRQRPGGDADEVGGTYPAGEGSSHRRKRKAAPEEADVDAPATKHRAVEGGAGSPHREARSRAATDSHLPPLYSIETLFTEKDLTFNLNAAAIATAQYFSDLKARVYGLKVKDRERDYQDPVNGLTANGAERKDGQASGGEGSTPEGEGGEEPALAAPEMDRAANQSHHATRSTRQGITVLGDVNIVQRITAYGLTAPIILPSSSTKTSAAPPALAMSAEELKEDLDKMERMLRGPPETTDEKLLSSVCEMVEWQALDEGLPLVELPSFDDPALLTVEPSSSLPQPAAPEDVPMSRQSSQVDANDVGEGGVPMSRGGSSMGGGTSMRRTASGTGGGQRRNGERRR